MASGRVSPVTLLFLTVSFGRASSQISCLGSPLSAAAICPISRPSRTPRMAPGRPIASQESPAQHDGEGLSRVTSRPRNVLGSELQCCCQSPRTGFFRDGYCQTGPEDIGRHTVCAIVTDEFLQLSASRGNDLRTPAPAYGFPGLKNGDKWCLCVLRWKEALEAGVAPSVVLEACHEKSLQHVSLADLQTHAVTAPPLQQ
jgi:uncharacterized protein